MYMSYFELTERLDQGVRRVVHDTPWSVSDGNRCPLEISSPLDISCQDQSSVQYRASCISGATKAIFVCAKSAAL